MMRTIGLISLGCPRNLVDSEIMLGLLKKEGFRITEAISECDLAVINTCSFIEDAKKESIDLILQITELKRENKIKSIIVAGCLPQRYPRELKKEIKEIDAFLGTGDFAKIVDVIKEVLKGKKIFEVSKTPSFLANHTYPRDLITPKHFIYLKVAEGCHNNCSYCVIPKIRGRLRSRSIDSLLEEARLLSKRHKISEINLVGQDITLYGTDLYGELKLSELLKRLIDLKLAKWTRLLYTHPEHYTDDLIKIIKNDPSLCKYLDLPLQHINDRILKLMNRRTNKKAMIKLISRLRKEIPNLAIRTTFIVGFPSETEKDFMELVGFIKEMKFERLGVFEYSREEGTKAYDFKDQIPDKVKRERFDAIMKLQQEVSKEINAKFLGKELEVLIDELEGDCFVGPACLADRVGRQARPPRNDVIASPNGVGAKQSQTPKSKTYIGRTEHDAPEVDGNCFIHSKRLHKAGDFVKVKIVDTLEYDLVGEELDVIPAPCHSRESGNLCRG